MPARRQSIRGRRPLNDEPGILLILARKPANGVVMLTRLSSTAVLGGARRNAVLRKPVAVPFVPGSLGEIPDAVQLHAHVAVVALHPHDLGSARLRFVNVSAVRTDHAASRVAGFKQ